MFTEASDSNSWEMKKKKKKQTEEKKNPLNY